MEVSLLSRGEGKTLETVRVLHETVHALRAALEGSRKELLELRSRFRDQIAAENDGCVNAAGSMDKGDDGKLALKPGEEEQAEAEEEEEEEEDGKQDSGTESEDIDDIELVFTTAETDPGAIHEDMVPICDDRKPVMHTVILETDISKCGVIDENDSALSSRRNTLPDPLPYRPIIHREILAARGSPRKARGPPPEKGSAGRQESGAQTDITAVPAQWKSETYLAHKMPNLTTLPSKFTLPVPRAVQLPLSDKSREARRVLLSDINFTSMVPELSRSADHLHQDEDVVRVGGDFLKETGWYGRVPRCDAGRHGSRSSWGSRCQASTTSIVVEEPRRRHSWRAPVVCCHARHAWSSVPSFRCHPGHHVRPDDSWTARRSRSKVHRCCPSGQSLPDLRPDGDSGESTDSLIDEAEEFLRRSIDNMMLARVTCKKGERRHSESDSVIASRQIVHRSALSTTTGFEPPKSAQPFLPKAPTDLKQDCLAKVITADGRIVMGRVRYSGRVDGKPDPHVGIELQTGTGDSDGAYMGHRYFDCKPDHAIFVPFKKVVLAWCT